jgi:probable rRNA maturation factor
MGHGVSFWYPPDHRTGSVINPPRQNSVSSRENRAALVAALRTMIVLDPELETEAAPRLITAGQGAAPGSKSAGRLPSPRTLEKFLREAQTAARLRGLVTVLLTGDREIRRLNRRFRGKNKATDVLSFPAETVGPVEIAGDLAISVDTARRQAMEQGHPLGTEIKVLILHGVLHLAGYDHEADTGQMARRERLLRGRMKLPQGLIERATATTRAAKRPSSTTKKEKPAARRVRSAAKDNGGARKPRPRSPKP